MTDFKIPSEGAVVLTKPACVYAYEANLGDANRKRLAEWRKRKGEKQKSPYDEWEKFVCKAIIISKWRNAIDWMAENNIELRKWK